MSYYSIREPSIGFSNKALRWDHGFTLLEVMVALVLLASIGMAAFSWINTSFISVERINRVTERSDMVANGMALLRNLNPMLDQQGDIETEFFHVSWRADEFLPPVTQKRGSYVVAVYKISAVISPIGNRESFEFSFLQNGYQPFNTSP